MSDSTKSLLPSEADTWLVEHPDVNRGELEEVWKLSELADIPFEPDEERISEMRDAITVRMTSEKRTGLRFIRSQRWLNIAASVALVAGFGAALWLRPIVETAPAGATASVVLPDGSTISLNSGSTIEYRRTFGWMKRGVALHGEAFFDVTKSQTEFEVSTFNGHVTVLGTSFNIRAWSDDLDPSTTVHVDEGYVRVSAEAVPDSSVILEGGQWSTIKGSFGPTAPSAISNRAQPAWQSGGMVISNQSLHDVAAEIERRFDVHVLVRPDSMLGESVSLHLANASDVGTVLDMIAAVHGLHVKKTEEGFELVAK